MLIWLLCFRALEWLVATLFCVSVSWRHLNICVNGNKKAHAHDMRELFGVRASPECMREGKSEWSREKHALEVERERHNGTDSCRKKNFHVSEPHFEGEKGAKNGRDCQHSGKMDNLFPGKLF